MVRFHPSEEVLPKNRFRVHYDAVRTHTALGRTPAYAAGLDLPDGFRWKEILERAVISRTVTGDASGQTAAKSPD